MTRSPSLLVRLATLAAIAAIVATACGAASTPSASTGAAAPSTGASAAPASGAPASTEPSGPPPSAAPAFTGNAYPVDGDAPCGVAPYTGSIKRIVATDPYTVEFHMCAPDVAFLPKVAFSSFGIQDSDYVAAHAFDKSILTQPNGTGPYKLKQWDQGNRLVFEANPDYWGTKALTPNLELRWSETSAQRLLELQSGNVDGIDNPGKEEIPTIQADSSLKFYPRPGMNTFYIGFNRTMPPFDNVDVRKAIAMGIDRDRLVKNFYPDGSEVATHFTPCAPLVNFGCEGDDWYGFDATAAKDLLTKANFDFSKTYKLSFRNVVRGYLPDAPVVATELQTQLKENLGINVELDLQESGAFSKAVTAGTLPLFLYGWGADYPDITNFLDFHFGSGSGPKFGGAFDDVAAALTKGATSPADADRKAAYTDANNLIKEHVPVAIMAHGASGTAFQANVEGGVASPLTSELFAQMKAPDDTLTFMQGAEPISLYCADESDGESLRACEQVNESLYAYEQGGTAPVPSLAKECKPNADLTVWTCTLQQGVKFHDGATFDATDVISTYALQWDYNFPNRIGNSGAFEYFGGLWGGYLNPPPPKAPAPSAPASSAPAPSPS